MIKQNKEFGRLNQVVVCPPTYMKIDQVINETQKYYEDDNINVAKAMEQHKVFVEELRNQGAEVIELAAEPSLNEQVFTRDIGFVIGENLYTAKMGRKIREPEIEALVTFLKSYSLTYESLYTHSIEGGDVIVAGDTVWIGISERTTYEAVDSFQAFVKNKRLVPIPIRKDILHLDCCFNLVSEKEGLIYSPAFEEKELQKLRERYDLIEVSDDEQFTLGTNVLSLGDQRIISLPENKQVNQALRDRGYYVIEVPFSEIIKSGGSFRCCTMPLERG
ncbi:arginine deiminase family protein [Gracilibacillus sp. YIM 98692]|uniref:dimethylarginine dimethylaminohydrolase family protein n=1 Tax=Gracilibacillus sp. YIM 98692 TaxID=2663532 RepID=UPI0013D81DDC|nr:arginine deiminase family protein [Gracilibacillus sp. YIM 98692]